MGGPSFYSIEVQSAEWLASIHLVSMDIHPQISTFVCPQKSLTSHLCWEVYFFAPSSLQNYRYGQLDWVCLNNKRDDLLNRDCTIVLVLLCMYLFNIPHWCDGWGLTMSLNWLPLFEFNYRFNADNIMIMILICTLNVHYLHFRTMTHSPPVMIDCHFLVQSAEVNYLDDCSVDCSLTTSSCPSDGLLTPAALPLMSATDVSPSLCSLSSQIITASASDVTSSQSLSSGLLLA